MQLQPGPDGSFGGAETRRSFLRLPAYSRHGFESTFTQVCKMNKVYKSVWNESLGAWVAVAENSAGRGKKASGKTRASLALSTAALASASLGLPSAASAAVTQTALFNDFTDTTC